MLVGGGAVAVAVAAVTVSGVGIDVLSAGAELLRASSKPASSRDRFREGDGLVVPLVSPVPVGGTAGYVGSSVLGVNWNGSWEGEITMAGPSLFIRGDIVSFFFLSVYLLL